MGTHGGILFVCDDSLYNTVGGWKENRHCSFWWIPSKTLEEMQRSVTLSLPSGTHHFVGTDKTFLKTFGQKKNLHSYNMSNNEG